MPRQGSVGLTPRKLPVQARSNTSVDSILEATIQVLVSVGKQHLTTTRVAHRAGVSVGTLYQYFPNKNSLLQTALRKHLESIAAVVEQACINAGGGSLSQMSIDVAQAFLQAKMKNLEKSIALYAVSSDVEGWRIARQIESRMNKAIVLMIGPRLKSLAVDPQPVASMIQAAMSGVGRALLEASLPDKQYELLRRELAVMLRSYIEATLHQAQPMTQRSVER